ncbi:MAG: Cj0069 family protein [Candidatus Latescibacteria bacterium]|nr:Cj0069 family protein [Candidatus Latescibacterota bacterium]
MLTKTTLKVALLWHGDREARSTATLEKNRFGGVAQALRQVGIEAEPAVYADEFADEVRDQLLKVHGVLVWVNPIEQGRDRSILNAMLLQVADAGVLVSAHPEVILKMGTKEVLFRTRDMGWGCDIHLYATAQELRAQLPRRLAEGKPRVLKQYRGNGGNGVWKVEGHPNDSALVRVRHALRGSVEEDISLDEFLARCEGYFGGAGRLIDQAYQERLTEGMVRCYLVRDRVVGFGHQLINALFLPPLGAAPGDAPQPGPRLYYPATKPEFQLLKTKMEEEWLPAMQQVLDIDTTALPVIWDADFLYGPKAATGEDTYVLCEINVSSVYPFPDEALEPLARETAMRLMKGVSTCAG